MKTLHSIPFFFGKEAVAGLDVGENYIAAACLSPERDGHIKVEHLGWVDKRPDASLKVVASLIKGLWRKNRISTRTVSTCLHSPSLVLKYFKYSNLPSQELESTLRLEAEQIFNKPQRELFIDWHLFSADSSARKEIVNGTQHGILFAVPGETVKKQLSILEMAGLYPVMMDVGCTATSNLFLKLRNPAPDNVHCLVNIADHRADVSILSAGPFIYPRVIYSQAVSWSERLDYLIKNIEDILRYYQFKLRRKPVNKLIFTGQLPANGGLQKEIKKALDLPVEFWNPLNELSLKRDIPDKKLQVLGPAMSVCLGLAMRREKSDEF
ncbi:MAG: pilus assembly protein PilM [Candidatus Omnitrophica bacterium]|nr:pilus assembly protein PilM [Candidatus Omnitrophota bacterium]